jgi:hypothetical protein
MMISSAMAGWYRGFGRVLACVSVSAASSKAVPSLFLQPGTTLRNVVIPQYSDTLQSSGILRVVAIQVSEDGVIQADRLSAELIEERGGRGALRAGSAVLERSFDGIRTVGGTELRMGGVELKTDGMTGDLKALRFVSMGGFQLKCQAENLEEEPVSFREGGRALEWKPVAGDLGRGRGPMAGPKSPNDAFWFDGHLSRCFDFLAKEEVSAFTRQDSVSLLSKGPGSFQINDGAYSSSGGVLIRFSLGMFACGERVDVLWGSRGTVREPSPSQVMPGDLRRLHAVGGCHVRVTDRKGRVRVVVCEELRYSGRTGLISLKGGYPRIDSEEGRMMASSENQFIRINAEGRLILGPGHWQSDLAL